MINSLEIYEDTGRKAGKAMRQCDVALAQSLFDWLRKELRRESPGDYAICKARFDRAYKEETGLL